MLARIRDPGGAGIGDQGYGFPPAKLLQQGFLPDPAIVLMVTDQRLVSSVVAKELPGPPGVFGRDQVYFLEHPPGPQGDVFQVADGRGNDVKNPQGCFFELHKRLSRSSPRRLFPSFKIAYFSALSTPRVYEI